MIADATITATSSSSSSNYGSGIGTRGGSSGHSTIGLRRISNVTVTATLGHIHFEHPVLAMISLFSGMTPQTLRVPLLIHQQHRDVRTDMSQRCAILPHQRKKAESLRSLTKQLFHTSCSGVPRKVRKRASWAKSERIRHHRFRENSDGKKAGIVAGGHDSSVVASNIFEGDRETLVKKNRNSQVFAE
jgi:hypothetical protein